MVCGIIMRWVFHLVEYGHFTLTMIKKYVLLDVVQKVEPTQIIC